LRDTCDNALAAADLDAADERPSRRTRDAAEAALALVAFTGAFRCERALPAAIRDEFPVEDERRANDARVATRGLVTLLTSDTSFREAKCLRR
jgi:hypothetical protein